MRLLGVNIPDEKRIEVALTYVHGIGLSSSKKILSKAGVDPSIRVKNIVPEEINSIRKVIEASYNIEGELKQKLRKNIGRLKTFGSYRGSRHIKSLPARGQRTKTNNRTRRGNVRRTAGSGKRKLELK